MPRSKLGITRPKVDHERLKEALTAVLNGRMKAREAARHFNLSRTTVQRHIDRHKKSGMAVFKYENKCDVHLIFTRDEEESLSSYLLQASKMHYGLGRRDTCVLAYEFAKQNKKAYPSSWDKNEKAGKQWYAYFMRRQRNVLSLRKPEATSLARATAFNRHTVSTFFKKYTQLMDKYKFPAHNIYNMDESGLSTVHKPGKVVAERGSKQVGSITSGERGSTVTIVGCVSASGNAIPPLLIFPRVNVQRYMLLGAPSGTICAPNPSGWINKNIFVGFLHHFANYAKPTKEQPVLLILDNHESHISVDAIDYARNRGIVMLTIPPHTSHKLQPLDRGVFGPLKSYFGVSCSDWLRSNPGRQISIQEIACLVGKSFPLAFSPVNILSGFRVSGIWPVDENIFGDHEFLSSSVTDRPLAEIENIQLSSSLPLPEQENANGLSKSQPPQIICEPSTSGISPFQVKPLPKAAPRKQSNKGRKPGRCRVLTDTPEKMEIAAAAENRRAKVVANSPHFAKNTKTVSKGKGVGKKTTKISQTSMTTSRDSVSTIRGQHAQLCKACDDVKFYNKQWLRCIACKEIICDNCAGDALPVEFICEKCLTG